MKNKIPIIRMIDEAGMRFWRSPDFIEGLVHQAVQNDFAPELARVQKSWDEMLDQLRKKDFGLADDLEGAMLMLLDERTRSVWRLAYVAALRLTDGSKQQIAAMLSV